MTRTLLIVGAGPDQVPAIQMARAMGYRVVATDRDPRAPGARLAHAFEIVSTGDRAGNLQVAERMHIQGVLTLGSETAVPVVAHVAQRLSLPGCSERTAYLATNKNAMRAAFHQHAVPAPASMQISTEETARHFCQKHGFPVVIKPSDCSGQRGTEKIETPDRLLPALGAALGFSTDGQAIIETFCEGPEINVTAVVIRGEPHFLSFSDRVTAQPPHFGIAIEHISPPAVGEPMRAAIEEASRQAIAAIGLQDGIAYPQVIASPEGPKVIEIAARIPGGYMREVALHMSGVDLVEAVILQAMGEDIDFALLRRHPRRPAVSVKFLTALDFSRSISQVVEAVEGAEAVLASPHVLLGNLRLAPGAPLPPLTSSAARFGATIAWGQDRAEACRLSRAAAEHFRVRFALPQHTPDTFAT